MKKNISKSANYFKSDKIWQKGRTLPGSLLDHLLLGLCWKPPYPLLSCCTWPGDGAGYVDSDGTDVPEICILLSVAGGLKLTLHFPVIKTSKIINLKNLKFKSASFINLSIYFSGSAKVSQSFLCLSCNFYWLYEYLCYFKAFSTNLVFSGASNPTSVFLASLKS